MVCEVRVTNLDLGRWARFPVAFVRWRADRSVDDCSLDQLAGKWARGHMSEAFYGFRAYDVQDALVE